MRDLLERVAKCMPEGWELRPWSNPTARPRFYNWHLRTEGGGMALRPHLGDIGLAPLTALLKQELAEYFHQFGVMYGEGQVYIETDAEAGLMRETEFEAVCNAYLALKTGNVDGVGL